MVAAAAREGGWKAVCGCTPRSLAAFRFCLGCLLTLELVLRFRFLEPFYSDEGTLPLRLQRERVDHVYKCVCFHCHFGQVWQQQILLSIQVALAACFTLGIRGTKIVSILSWYFYLSLTLRNTWMNYILDRYFHYFLFLSMFLPLTTQERKNQTTASAASPSIILSPGTIAMKLLVVWIYIDAGGGKLMDPLGGWSYNADPLPALDTYARHTLVARYMYALVGPEGLRLMTPVVVWVELLAAPVALLGSFLGSRALINTAFALIISLHVGIALTLRNAALLQFVACTAWIVFLPLGGTAGESRNKTKITEASSATRQPSSIPLKAMVGHVVSTACILSIVVGNFWLETISRACDQSVKHIWSTLLHNRWNVFVGAEEYVTWEIAPGLLADGSVVDVWGRVDEVSWDMPGTGAPCTSTARPGRWRSFPYLAELTGEDAEALWSYLCREWDRNNNVDDQNPGRKLIKYNFFMLQADVLPNMQFSATRKRLIQTYECSPLREYAAVDENADDISREEKADTVDDESGKDEL